MGICWYCHWGWSKPVVEIYKKAASSLDGYTDPLNFGPSHIVWEDENFDSAEWCLENFDKYKGDFSEFELSVVRQSLEELANLPVEAKCVEPDEYNDENPELYPPPSDVEMEKIR